MNEVKRFGKIVNGYAAGLPHFDKPCDGETVVECGPDEPGALPFEDAERQLRALWDAEAAEMDAAEARWEAEAKAEARLVRYGI